MMLMRPRPGREKAAEYGSSLILICWMAEVLTSRLFTSMPFTSNVTPAVPSDALSRNCEMVATASSSKIGRLSSAPWVTDTESAFPVALVVTCVAPVTVTSWCMAASASVTRSGFSARRPTSIATRCGWNPPSVTRRMYRPGGTESKTNVPRSVVVADRATDPDACVSSTSAAGSTAPVSSTTTPARVPRGAGDWANAAAATVRHHTMAAARTQPAGRTRASALRTMATIA